MRGRWKSIEPSDRNPHVERLQKTPRQRRIRPAPRAASGLGPIHLRALGILGGKRSLSRNRFNSEMARARNPRASSGSSGTTTAGTSFADQVSLKKDLSSRKTIESNPMFQCLFDLPDVDGFVVPIRHEGRKVFTPQHHPPDAFSNGNRGIRHFILAAQPRAQSLVA